MSAGLAADGPRQLPVEAPLRRHYNRGMKNHRRSFTFAGGFSAAIALVVCAGCRPAAAPEAFRPANARYRIAVAEVSQETNSFSPVPTTLADFEAEGIWRGDEIIDRSLGAKTAIGGFLKAVHDLGRGEVEVVPLLRASAVPGGAVKREVYEQFKTGIVEGLRAAGRIEQRNGDAQRRLPRLLDTVVLDVQVQRTDVDLPGPEPHGRREVVPLRLVL